MNRTPSLSLHSPNRAFGPRHARPLMHCALLAALVAASGCKSDGWKFASWDVRKAVGLKRDGKPDPETPSRLVTTWTEATLSRPGETPKRGFGGRLAFFKQDSQDPVRVEGQLVVYAFDESGADPYKTEPTRRYVFPADQLAIYESPSQLGPSYSVWLPWDDRGGPEAKISLIARFEPKKGPVVVGEQTKHYLAGPTPAPAPGGGAPQLALTPTPAEPAGVQTAGFQTSGVAGAAAAQASVLSPVRASVASLDTTTIALPRRLNSAPGAALRSPPAPPAVGGSALPQHAPQQPQSSSGQGAAIQEAAQNAVTPASALLNAGAAPDAATSAGVVRAHWQMPVTPTTMAATTGVLPGSLQSPVGQAAFRSAPRRSDQLPQSQAR